MRRSECHNNFDIILGNQKWVANKDGYHLGITHADHNLRHKDLHGKTLKMRHP